MSELLPCPFCGCSAKIAQCDDEGNVRGEEYESNPWSGLGYRIVHESDNCIISTGEDGYNLIYDSREEAISHWNRRAERTCHLIYCPDVLAGSKQYMCSSCRTYQSDGITYCPNCGSKVVE